MDAAGAQDERIARRRRTLRPRGSRPALVLLLLGSACYVGCSQDTRYRVLSFFFDGVPSPNAEREPEKVAGPWGIPLDANDPRAAPYQAARAAGPPRTLAVVSEHRPYQTRECFACHEAESSLVSPEMKAGLCVKCHATYADPDPADWVHGPVALGMCGYCHEPHKSAFPSLLTRAQQDLCLNCHAGADLKDLPYHRAAGNRTCSTCHDPHMAGNRLLLVDSGTYRRRGTALLPHVEHAPWKERQCTACHLPEQSNAVREDVNHACLSCHEEVVERATERRLHKAVLEDKCLICHSPHRSPRSALVRTTAEQMCLACHEIEDVRKPGHPPVERADCLLCHVGHTAERDHLLRVDVPPAEAAAAEPTPSGGRGAPPAVPRAEAAVEGPDP